MKRAIASRWSLYILRCKDRTLYTGIAIDVAERLEKHAAGKGAKYTRGRGPLKLLYVEKNLTESEAKKREREVKSWTREQKEKFLVDKAKKS